MELAFTPPGQYMSNEIYRSPEAQLTETKAKTSASRAEQLAQSRRDMQEAEAIERLNLVWGIRFIVDVLFCILGLAIIYQAIKNQVFITSIGGVFLLLFFGSEIVAIIAYFQRRPWCVIPLHIFSAVSFLNFPFGSICSLIHYFNMHKIQFEK